MLCPTAGHTALLPSAQRSPQLPFPIGKAMGNCLWQLGEAKFQTYIVGLCPPWLFPCFCVQQVCREIATLKEGSCVTFHGLVAYSCSFTLKKDTVLFWFFTSFQTHMHAIFSARLDFEPILALLAMSLTFRVSLATACDVYAVGKQQATGKPEDLPEAWKKTLQSAYIHHRIDEFTGVTSS